MPSIAFWAGVPGGTGQYRCWTPGAALKRAGWDVVYIETEDDPIDADVLVLGRVIGEFIPAMIDELHARSDTVVVYDIDDWFDDIPEYNPANSVELWQVHEAMTRADLITVTTPGLAQLYGRFAPTVVLPNYLDPEVWADCQKERQSHLGVNLSWLAAYKWRGGDLEVLRPWLPEFLEEHPAVSFGALGCPELLEDIGISGYSTPMAAYEFLPKMLSLTDIGLVPLTYNTFNWQGKSACKSMEYGAMGIPSVASPSEANRAYIQPGVNGLLVRKNNWGQQIEAVMSDLAGYSKRARQVAEGHFIDDHIDRWVNAYSQGRSRRHLGSGRAVPAAVS